MELLNPLSIYRANSLFLRKEYFRSDVVLSPTADPRVFTTPEIFFHDPGRLSIEVYHNGRRLMFSPTRSPKDGDYFVAESAPGFGYNQVCFVSLTPNVDSSITGSYYAA
jgi:hypothetical protein